MSTSVHFAEPPAREESMHRRFGPGNGPGLPLKTRIVLVSMPRMQREILSESLAAPDIEIADGAGDGAGLIEAAEESGAEFVIAGAGRFAPDEVARLLDVHPGVKVLALSESGRQGLLYELRPHRIPIGDLSPDALLATIRGSRRRASGPTRTTATEHRR